MGSANNPQSIDAAVLDRFDMKIDFHPPNSEQLRAAMSYHARQLSEEDYLAALAGFR